MTIIALYMMSSLADCSMRPLVSRATSSMYAGEICRSG